MIVCKQCGHHNEDSDTFCGSCGKFLEWTGERVVVAQPEPEPPPPEPEPEPARLGLIDRVKHAVGMEEAAAQPAAPAQPDGAPAPVVAPTPISTAPPAAAPATPAYGPQPVWSVPVTSAGRPAAPPAPPAAAPTAPASEPVMLSVSAPAVAPAAAPAAPVAQVDEPLSRRPTSVAPAVTRPRPAPRTLEPPTRRRPGDLICGQCGEGNDPTRHFCRRCGNSLDEAIAVRLPWYRRFFNRLFGVRTREAGWRPHRVGPPNVMGMVWRIIRLTIAAIIVVAVLAFLLVPSFHTLVVDRVTAAATTIRKAIHPNYDPIYPTGVTASSSIAGHLPTLTDDRIKGTYWGALLSDRSPTITFRFASPQDIAEMGFTSGASGTAPTDQFLAQPRPQKVHLVFSNGTSSTSQDLTLSDTDSAKFYAISNAKQVTVVAIEVVSVYPATLGPPSMSVAIDEVEFRVKN